MKCVECYSIIYKKTVHNTLVHSTLVHTSKVRFKKYIMKFVRVSAIILSMDLFQWENLVITCVFTQILNFSQIFQTKERNFKRIR